MTGVSECSQQRGSLKDDGYIKINTKSSFTLYKNELFQYIPYGYSRCIATARE
ncbi:hypothetical protein [Photorhabdus bodei]|uniref:Uncharacterized protein n=1 Tax=Photorhabdus bodei TaxID=2029681 RepID=A0AAW6BNY7_9GAMM|nr:hypothetical protein [Photorhabdus bodei]MDB6373590.1 hypothetical protein [Photorhabdus bodei]